jgi:hypothetical protein
MTGALSTAGKLRHCFVSARQAVGRIPQSKLCLKIRQLLIRRHALASGPIGPVCLE